MTFGESARTVQDGAAHTRRIVALMTAAFVVAAVGLVGPLAVPASATTIDVANEDEYRDALDALSLETSGGPHTINITSSFDVSFTDGDPTYTGTDDLIIVGAPGGLFDEQYVTRTDTGNVRFLLVNSDADVTIDNLVLNDFLSTNGGAVAFASEGELTVTGSGFSNNTSTFNGGALWSPYGDITVSDSAFTNSATDTGGGAIFTITGAINVTDTSFTDNSSDGEGGAIHTSSGAIDISGGQFDLNVAEANGGAIYTESGDLNATEVTFSDNTASRIDARGGAIYAGDAVVTVDGGGFADNDAALGGAIYSANSTVTVTGAAFSSNLAGALGGAVSANAGTLTLQGSTFDDNDSGGGGGAIHVFDAAASIASSTFDGNESALSGGAIHIENSTDVTVNDSTFINNSADTGGAIRAYTGSVDVASSTFDSNAASGSGGAVSTHVGDITLAHVTLERGTSPAVSQIATTHSNGTLTLFGSVLTSSSSGSAHVCEIAAGGTVTSLGYNVVKDSSCGSLGSTDDVGVDLVVLDPLADNGGPTNTMMPRWGSVVLDAIPAADCDSAYPTDQRGVVRAQDGACDIGAVEREPVDPPFSDVDSTHPFAGEIDWLDGTGITGGYNDGTFRPGATVSRQAMAAFLYRADGSPAFDAPAIPTFTDVPTDHPFYDEIEWLADSGITEGYEDGSFGPTNGVSRMAMAAFLHRFAEVNVSPGSSVPTFIDVDTDHPFYDEVEWLAQTGITGGYEDGTFRPSNGVSRMAMAAFLYRYDVLPS